MPSVINSPGTLDTSPDLTTGPNQRSTSPHNIPDPLADLTDLIPFGRNAYMFPADLDNRTRNVIEFANYDYSRPTIKSIPKGIRQGLVMLPIPKQLETGYTQNWSDESLGTIGNIAAREISGQNINSLKASLKDIDAESSMNIVKEAIIGKGLDWILKPSSGDSIFKDLGQGIQTGLGVAKNPFQALLYTGPDFRKHQFEWKFIPVNNAESETLQKVIKLFKMAQAPSYIAISENKLFNYPQVWTITFKDSKYLFNYATSVLTDVHVDYHADDAASYHVDNAPTSISLRLNFMEAVILTREDISKGNY